jgi:hypothetical protein
MQYTNARSSLCLKEICHSPEITRVRTLRLAGNQRLEQASKAPRMCPDVHVEPRPSIVRRQNVSRLVWEGSLIDSVAKTRGGIEDRHYGGYVHLHPCEATVLNKDRAHGYLTRGYLLG